ncbi:ATP-grasp domain-containing protein [Singulisphaera acidiphila]|uniref:Putative ATP-dependent carboligase n=1 Tax=Singulisphaera acidiphila (strain ATCC BAA-1392 / DSM 18658 / VKM B-2454 / MOB10) TaxID=886293 RepID=L0DJU4_SINAD|nr:ATP-grasp domain-containing protein [Singulisphaera acidiphila]AGA29108.1 putative ATP-dependent carboligase [Singulisphaera acidiphila DSM 18658]
MDLLILGASARAAAYSARRAQLQPRGIDLFADADLTSLCPARRIAPEDYPHRLAELALESSSGPWLYTGALENQPDLIDRIAAQRPLWGNGGTVLRAVRDPFAWSAALHRAGLPCPAIRSTPEHLPRDGSWLVKPIASAGGMKIHPLDVETPSPAWPCFYQERIEGLNLSAIFMSRPEKTTFAGVTRQILGAPGADYAYVGSVGPWPLRPIEATRIRTLGTVLAQSFGLRGLFGVDFILADGHPWPVEINPRYTASVEVLELALGTSLLSAHRSVFDPTAPAVSPAQTPKLRGAVGKLILFAPGKCHFPKTTRSRPASKDVFAIPPLGDRPQPGICFEPGEPVATLFEQADHMEACLAQLEQRRARWEQRLLILGSQHSSIRI